MDVFGVASRHVAWLQSRQQVLAQNIANSDTARYQARDLADFNPGTQSSGLLLTSTHTRHIGFQDSAHNGGSFESVLSAGSDVTHSGNNVNLEREMKKVGETGLSFSFDTSVSKVFHRMLLASVKG